MKSRIAMMFSAALLCGSAGGACAADIVRVPEASPMAPFVALAAVPPGYTTYYISGSVASPKTPAANGKPADWGDISYQTKSCLENLKATMAKAGIGLGDVVQAHVYLDPKADFMAMNKVWLTEFGTKEQPNKPARAAFHVQALAGPGPLLEIEFIAAKKVK